MGRLEGWLASILSWPQVLATNCGFPAPEPAERSGLARAQGSLPTLARWMSFNPLLLKPYTTLCVNFLQVSPWLNREKLDGLMMPHSHNLQRLPTREEILKAFCWSQMHGLQWVGTWGGVFSCTVWSGVLCGWLYLGEFVANWSLTTHFGGETEGAMLHV